MEITDLIAPANGGLNQDDAIEYIEGNIDSPLRRNLRTSGTANQQAGKSTSIEDMVAIGGALLPGINDVIGGNKFTDTGQIIAFRYNSNGNNEILLYDNATNTLSVIYTDLTNSAGETLLPLNPQNWVNCELINSTYLVWWAKGLEVGYCNLKTLASGGYGTVLPEDLSLLKPQCPFPPTGTYGNDAGQPANYLFGYLPQFNCQYINADYNYSAWSTWSARVVPYQQNTPIAGADVTQNNYIIVSVYMGSIRVVTTNIAARFGTDSFYIIKSVDRAYVLALPNTSVSVATEVYEAYDPSTNLYSFAFYNNSVKIPVPDTQTNQTYDYIWPSEAGAKINGNYIALGNFSTLYPRPSVQIVAGAVGYNPNITIPLTGRTNPFKITGAFYGESNSGEGNHKRLMTLTVTGIPVTGDVITVTDADIHNASSTLTYSYTVPSSQTGNLGAVVASFAAKLPNSSYAMNGSSYTIDWVDQPYYGMQSNSIQLFYAGATVANSIPTALDNTVYQLALSFRDSKQRFLPLCTDNTYIIPTPSYAQVNGNAIQITWAIQSAPPTGAVDAQWVITKPPVDKLLDVSGVVVHYISSWDAKANSPSLSLTGTYNVGDTYQITTPCDPTDTAHYTNLGNGEAYNTSDYIMWNGKFWGIINKDFGDLTSTGSILAFCINPLNLFNQQYSNEGVNTVLSYDYAAGDRCTLHYYINGGSPVYINNPCVNLSVLGFDPTNYLVKMEKSATFDTSALDGLNTFLRLYSPSPNNQAASTNQNTTVWYEIGDLITITNGAFDKTSGIINDGGAYYKTRVYEDAISPYSNPPIEYLATDLNYSDFYQSAFSSFGRVRTYYDELEQTDRAASIITSQAYITGSKVNGLNTFYQGNIYGDGDGETSSSKGGIMVLWQRGDVLLAIQKQSIFYIPVNITYTQLNAEDEQESISNKLLNNGRYEAKEIGIGNFKESFCTRFDVAYMIDGNNFLPVKIESTDVLPIPKKMSKFFKSAIRQAALSGVKIPQYYNDFYEELLTCIQAQSSVVVLWTFNNTDWQVANAYTIPPSGISDVTNPTNATVSYNDTTGIATYTPTGAFVGNTVGTFQFNPGSGVVTQNVCLTWIAGTTTVNPFSFTPLVGLPLSTLETSNSISVSGNNVPVAISITGGQYSVNGGAYTSSPGTVNPNDTVTVQVTTSSSQSTQTNAVLTVSGTSGTFSVTTGSETVNPFSFTSLTGQSENTLVTSNAITVAGNTLPAPISITGGQYSINGSAYTSVTGNTNAGDVVTVQLTTSSSYNTPESATLTIDGQNGTFTATTAHIQAFSFTPVNNAPLSTLETSNSITVMGADISPIPISITGGQYSINGGAYTSASGTTNIGDVITVQVTSSASNTTITSATLTILDQSATYNVTTLGVAGATGILVIDILTNTTINAYAYVNTPGATAVYQQPVYTGQNFLPYGSTDAANAWALSSDFNPPQPTRRFEFNIQKLIANYPAEPTFTFIIAGRDTSASTINGAYVNQSASNSNMIMNGSSGTYLPSVSGTELASTSYSGYAVVAGANGTYGIGVGAEIIKFVYNVSAQTITVSV